MRRLRGSMFVVVVVVVQSLKQLQWHPPGHQVDEESRVPRPSCDVRHEPNHHPAMPTALPKG